LPLLAEPAVLRADRLFALGELPLAALELRTLLVQLRVRHRGGLALDERLLATANVCLPLGQRALQVAELSAQTVQLGGLLALVAAHFLDLTLHLACRLEPAGRLGLPRVDAGPRVRKVCLALVQRLRALLELPRARVDLTGLLCQAFLARPQLLVTAFRVALGTRQALFALAGAADELLRVRLPVLERTLALVQ